MPYVIFMELLIQVGYGEILLVFFLDLNLAVLGLIQMLRILLIY